MQKYSLQELFEFVYSLNNLNLKKITNSYIHMKPSNNKKHCIGVNSKYTSNHS